MKRKRRFSERLLAILLALVLAVPMLMEPAAVSLGAEMGSVDVQNLDTGNGDPAEGGDGTGATPTSPSTVTPGTTPVTTPEVTPEPKYTLSGTVTCGGDPVSGATVTETITNQSVETDTNGQYTITNLSKEAGYNLQIGKEGFTSLNDIVGSIESENVTVQEKQLELETPTYTVDGRYNVDSELVFQVNPPAEGITYKWEFDDIFQPETNEGSVVKGSLLKSGILNVKLTASFGNCTKTGSGPSNLSINEKETNIEILVTPAYTDEQAGITELYVTATVSGINEGTVTFTENNGCGYFENGQNNSITLNLSGETASAVFLSNSPDGFGGELSFTGSYNGINGKYKESTKTVTGTYKSNKAISWLDKDIYGNPLTVDATVGNAVKIEYGSICAVEGEEKTNYYQIPVDMSKSATGGTDQYTFAAVDENGAVIAEMDLPFELDENTGKVTFTRAMSSDEKVYIQVIRKSDGYVDAVATLQITVIPREIQLDTDTITFIGQKEYDGTDETAKVVFAPTTVENQFERPDGKSGEAVLEGEVIQVSGVTGTVQGVIDAESYPSVDVTNVSFTLAGEDAANYAVTIPDNKVSANYTIMPKEYHIRFESASREYGQTPGSEGYVYEKEPVLSRAEETGFLSKLTDSVEKK